MTHTPGPWIYRTKLEADRPRMWWVEAKVLHGSVTGSTVARVTGLALRDYDASEANARLIAAAPELLDCLKDALTQIVEDHPVFSDPPETTDGAWLQTLCHRMRYAIAKAEGGS